MKLFAAALVILLALPVGTVAFPFEKSDTPIAKAMAYLQSRQTPAGDISLIHVSQWVAVAAAAANEDPREWRNGTGPSLCEYIASHAVELNTSKATDLEKFILAAAACRSDPHTFGGRDHVALLLDLQSGGQLGDPMSLMDDSWGVVALAAAGLENSSAARNSTQFLLSNQNADGGWGDPEATAAVLFALSAVHFPPSGSVLAARNYLKASQRDDGGYGYAFSNSGATSWVVSAVNALGEDASFPDWTRNGTSAADFLLGLQDPDGAFRYTSSWRMSPEWMTAYAVVALLGKWYPTARYPGPDVDSDPPKLGVMSPANESTAYAGPVTLVGWATDDVGLGEIRARIATGTWVACKGLSNWSCTLDVSVGRWPVQVQAVDLSGNVASAFVVLNVVPPPDTEPPTLVIVSPHENATVDAGVVSTKGWARDNTGLSDIRARRENGSWMDCQGLLNWSCEVVAPTGRRTVEVQATDLAGNSASALLHLLGIAIVRDTVPPSLGILRPVTGQIVAAGDVVLEGWASDDVRLAQVRARNGTEPWKICYGLSSWRCTLVLKPGTCTLMVQAEDAAGNMANVTIMIQVVSGNGHADGGEQGTGRHAGDSVPWLWLAVAVVVLFAILLVCIELRRLREKGM